MNPVDRAWLAAFIDGEGCITIHSSRRTKTCKPYFAPVIAVGQTKPGMINRARKITGDAGTLYYQGKDAPRKGVWTWRVVGKRAKEILLEILPYLILKQSQAILAVRLQNHNETRAMGSRPTDEDIAFRSLLKNEMHTLNRVGVQ